MVRDDATQAKGQDRQRRHTARTCPPHTHVQLSRIQGCAPVSSRYEPIDGQLIRVDSKVVYRRYASLFFVTGISQMDNELITLEIIHRYVEVLDRYFGNVCHASRPSPDLFFLTDYTRFASWICTFLVVCEAQPHLNLHAGFSTFRRPTL
jgi:hypothetical protein